MRSLKRLAPSPAMIVALLALTVALSGSAYAAVKINGKDIKARTITAKQIKNGTITGKQVKNGSIAKADLAKDVGTAGPAGPQGVAGPQGATGPQGAPGSARAWALVNKAGPALVTDRTHGFLSVSRSGIGQYCVKIDPATGIDKSKSVALANPEYGYSAGSDLAAYASMTDCATDEIGVMTMEGAGSFSDDVAFTVMVP